MPGNLFIVLIFANTAKAGENTAAYFQAKKYLNYLLSDQLHLSLLLEPIDTELDFAIARPYEPSRSALIKLLSGEVLGIIGEFKSSVITSLKLPINTAGFEIDIDALAKGHSVASYQPLNKYPEITQDITLKVGVTTVYIDLENEIKAALSAINNNQSQSGIKYTLRPLSIFQRSEDKDYKQITWHVDLYHPERTLNTDEANKVFDMIEVATKNKFNAERI